MTDLVTGQQSLTYEGARRALDTAVAEARRLGVAVCIAVADHAGHLLAFARMSGAPLLSMKLAQDKAWTVTAFNGVPTHEWFGMIEDEPPLLHGIVHTDRLIVFGGGVPVRVGGELVGAVGVSGGSAEQDRAIAEAGAGGLSPSTSTS
jgi:uncharacterized protein GlcG (DUF336 family)